jgi:hypothetical protein
MSLYDGYGTHCSSGVKIGLGIRKLRSFIGNVLLGSTGVLHPYHSNKGEGRTVACRWFKFPCLAGGGKGPIDLQFDDKVHEDEEEEPWEPDIKKMAAIKSTSRYLAAPILGCKF